MTIPSTTRPVLLALMALTMGACEQEFPSEVSNVELALVAGAKHGGAPLRTAMTQEVTATPMFAGDPDGTGSAFLTINVGQQEICWELSVSNILLPATASHIHKEAVGVRGPIVVGLSAPDASGWSSGCAQDIDRDLLKDILLNPADYYVNVHTTDFAPGAVRGQLN